MICIRRDYFYVYPCCNQISKKKLERVAVQGGDFGKAGRRTAGEMTVSHLRKLLEDDVEDLAKRFVCAEVRWRRAAVLMVPYYKCKNIGTYNM